MASQMFMKFDMGSFAELCFHIQILVKIFNSNGYLKEDSLFHIHYGSQKTGGFLCHVIS